MHKRTKIICTLGPATETRDVMTRMVKAGMNVARLNFSHGSHENHLKLMTQIREVATSLGEPVAVMQDLQGPKIRVGALPKEGVTLVSGEHVVFDTGTKVYAKGIIPVDYSELHQYVQSGERILLNDGRMEVTVTRVDGTRIETEVVIGGILTSHKGMNVPDSAIAARALTEKDAEDLRFGVEHDIDLVAVSFVRGPDDILDVRYRIKEFEKELKKKPEQPIRIIAKIERQEAVKNIKEILEVADGVMVARGDLGIEIPAQDVPLVQKEIIVAALAAAKPVIVATQMLDSMQENPRPTRAEVSDVANGAIDHADALMLSNETATGKYPVEAVHTMSTIIHRIEQSPHGTLPLEVHHTRKGDIDDVVSELSRLLAERVGAKLILTASLTGETARIISRYRPELPIAVATQTDRVYHQLNLSWGVVPFMLEPCASIEELAERAMLYLKENHLAHSGDKIIIVGGEPVGQAGNINLLEVREVV